MENTVESVINHIRSMMATPGWNMLVRQLNERRERIIAEGKKSKSEEKGIRTWSRLEGFDEAALLAERLGRLGDAGDGIENIVMEH